MRFSFDVDDRELRRLAEAAGERAYRLAGARVLSRAAVSARTKSSREIANVLGVPVLAVRKRFFTERATSKNLAATMTAYVRPFNPVTLGARQNSTGVAVGRGGGRQSWRGAFIATMPDGSRIAALRDPDSVHSKGKDRKGRPRKNRLPIFAVRVHVEEIANPIIRKVVAEVHRDMLTRTLPRELEYRLGLAAKGVG